MSGFGVPDDGSASLVLGLAIVLVSCIPLWALLLWAAAYSLSWRWRAERSWKRFLVPAVAFAAVIGSGYGLSWVMHGLFGPSRPTDQDVVYWVWMVQELLAGIAVIVVASARTSSGAGSVSGAHRKRRRGRAVILAWGALAVVLAVSRVFGGESAPSGDWCALAASSGLLLTLMVLLIIAIVELRKDATGSGPAATGSA